MPVSPQFRAFVEDQLGGLVPLRTRAMFGGVGLYADELFFALIDDDRLYFKVDDSTRSRYQRRGSKPFQPLGSPVMNGYWRLPDGVLDDADELAEWTREAVEVARGSRGRKRRGARGPTA